MKAAHEGNKPFKCISCDSSFVLKTGLTRHSRLAHGGMPYDCKKCYSGFAHKQDLESHKCKRKYNKKKLLKCEMCNAVFIFEEDMHSHINLVHEGRKLSDKDPLSLVHEGEFDYMYGGPTVSGVLVKRRY